MRVTLTDGDGRVLPVRFEEDNQYGVVEEPCGCGSKLVGGTGKEIESHDTYRADGLCGQCRAPRGIIRTRVETIFGLEEDNAVMNGRWRVY